ncbi:deoxyribose-phosphate aldolase [Corynebacterium mayonis]|uniref:deoxyribose-phosphate aldolase n=1 Tax=Corynebacterium mayonis TaxID=3062461 RepID=UPI0031401EB5
MDDLEWLAARMGKTCLGGQPSFALQADAGVVVEPTHVAQARSAGLRVICVVGWPTGRHHSVIKAAEARLAKESGASEVWLSVDDHADLNTILADVIAVQQAVPGPTCFGVIARTPSAAQAAAMAGADLIAVQAGDPVPNSPLPVSVYGMEEGLDGVVEALEAGADRVFV